MWQGKGVPQPEKVLYISAQATGRPHLIPPQPAAGSKAPPVAAPKGVVHSQPARRVREAGDEVCQGTPATKATRTAQVSVHTLTTYSPTTAACSSGHFNSSGGEEYFEETCRL